MPKMTVGQAYNNRKGQAWNVVDISHDGDFPVTARQVDGDGVIKCTHTGKVELKGTDPLDLIEKAEAAPKKAKKEKAAKGKKVAFGKKKKSKR